MSATTLEAADIIKLLSTLPHRYPFLMIDRIVEMKGDESAVGIKCVTFNEPQFQGHFPNYPVFPGVLIVEGMAQTAGALCQIAHNVPTSGQVFLLTIDKAKFRKPVAPGNVIEYHMVKKAQKRAMFWYRGEAKVGGEVVAEAEVGAMLIKG